MEGVRDARKTGPNLQAHRLYSTVMMTVAAVLFVRPSDRVLLSSVSWCRWKNVAFRARGLEALFWDPRAGFVGAHRHGLNARRVNHHSLWMPFSWVWIDMMRRRLTRMWCTTISAAIRSSPNGKQVSGSCKSKRGCSSSCCCKPWALSRE